MSQPKWKCVGRVGDVNPVEHNGGFVFVDETGVYDPEVVMIERTEGHDRWIVYRFICETCTYRDGVLSDNKFHPDKEAWFTRDMGQILRFNDEDPEEWIEAMVGDDVMERARAWVEIGEYWGFLNLDHEPREYMDSQRGELALRVHQYEQMMLKAVV